MKYFFPLLLAMLLGAVQAKAQISVTYNGEPVADGATLTFTAQPDPFGSSSTVLVGSDDPTFTNTSDQAVQLKVEVFCVKYQTLYWCGLTSACQSPTNMRESREVTLQPGGKKNMRLENKFNKTDYSTLSATITVYADGKKVLSFTEKFVNPAPSTGIASTQTTTEGISLDGRTLSYRFGAASALRTLTIYSIDGRMALRTAAAQTQGTISLSSLPAGAYVATISTAEGKTQSTKIVLR